MSAPRRPRHLLVVVSLAGFGVQAFVACEASPVLIGIETTADASIPSAIPTASPGPPPPIMSADAAPPPGDPPPGAIEDASIEHCAPDGGCPTGLKCWYLVEAGCGAQGECSPPLPIPPAPPGGAVSLGPRASAPERYAETPACDAASTPGVPSGS